MDPFGDILEPEAVVFCLALLKATEEDIYRLEEHFQNPLCLNVLHPFSISNILKDVIGNLC